MPDLLGHTACGGENVTGRNQNTSTERMGRRAGYEYADDERNGPWIGQLTTADTGVGTRLRNGADGHRTTGNERAQH